VSDHDAITDLMSDRSLCLGCIATKAGLNRFYVDAVLVDLVRLNRVASTPGRCRECRVVEIVFFARMR
jgi:hypothetical protein